jgi:hypothetical protein
MILKLGDIVKIKSSKILKRLVDKSNMWEQYKNTICSFEIIHASYYNRADASKRNRIGGRYGIISQISIEKFAIFKYYSLNNRKQDWDKPDLQEWLYMPWMFKIIKRSC